MKITLDHHAIRSIVKWELQRAPKGVFEAAHDKNPTARDDALSTLAERISKRLDAYTITREDLGRGDGAHLATLPDYFGKG